MSNPTGPQDPYSGQGDQYGNQPRNDGYSPSMGDGYSAPPPPPNYYGGGPSGPEYPSTEKNSLGVWALVLGILGILCCGFLTGIPAVILGGKSKQAAAEGRANNGGLGMAGFVLGWLAIVLSVVGLILFFVTGGTAAFMESFEQGYNAS